MAAIHPRAMPDRGTSPSPVGAVESALRRPLVVVVAVGIVALIVMAACSTRARPVWAGCAAAIAVGVAGPWFAVASVRGAVSFGRERCVVGERVPVEVRLRGAGVGLLGGPRGFTLRWPAGTASAEGRVGRSAAGIVAEVTMSCRGLQPRGCPSLASDWPFGLASARRRVGVAGRIVVRPRTFPVALPLSLLAPSRHGRHRSERVRGSEGDVLGVREYRRGDDPRGVHWVHTARRDTLVVRERPGRGLPAVRILLAALGASADCVDTISAVAASLVESWARRGVALGVCWGLEPIRSVRGPAAIDPILDAIACVEQPALLPPGGTVEELLRRCDRAGGRADLDVIVTGAGCPAGRPLPGAARRLWIVVAERATEPLAIAHQPGRDRVVVVPVGDRAGWVLDAALREAVHDPDAKRG